eukprot:1560382-Amphidinium_carterae.1
MLRASTRRKGPRCFVVFSNQWIVRLDPIVIFVILLNAISIGLSYDHTDPDERNLLRACEVAFAGPAAIQRGNESSLEFRHC